MKDLIEKGNYIHRNFGDVDSLSIKTWVAKVSLYIDGAFETTFLQNEVESLREIEINDISSEDIEMLLALTTAEYERKKHEEEKDAEMWSEVEIS